MQRWDTTVSLTNRPFQPRQMAARLPVCHHYHGNSLIELFHELLVNLLQWPLDQAFVIDCPDLIHQ